MNIVELFDCIDEMHRTIRANNSPTWACDMVHVFEMKLLAEIERESLASAAAYTPPPA